MKTKEYFLSEAPILFKENTDYSLEIFIFCHLLVIELNLNL